MVDTFDGEVIIDNEKSYVHDYIQDWHGLVS